MSRWHLFPKSHGKPWADDRRVRSDVVFVKSQRAAMAGYPQRVWPAPLSTDKLADRDWRRVAACQDRCPMAFSFTIALALALAATVIFWL